jgi:hypothetical protein
MTRKATPKKAGAKKSNAKPARAKPAKAKTTKKVTAKAPAARPARTPAVKRAKVFVVQRKLEGDTYYTEPDRVFATEEAARAHADALNRELLALAAPFEEYGAGSRIKGGDKALVALVAKMGLPPATKKQRYGGNLDWSAWWSDNYFNMTADQRDALCKALDRFEWYKVRTTTLE